MEPIIIYWGETGQVENIRYIGSNPGHRILMVSGLIVIFPEEYRFKLKQDIGEGAKEEQSLQSPEYHEDGFGFLILHQKGELKAQMKTTEREILAQHKEFFDH